ncbi:MAG: hypothetical protein ACQKBV_02095, partial [Puniceicoccales bacterium]
MKISPKLLSTSLAFIVAPLFVSADDISLNPSNWTANSDAKVTAQGDELRVKSLASSVWLAPAERIKYQQDDALEVQYALRGGNLIVQANWFDANGNYLETATLGKTTSDKDQALFRVAPSKQFVKAAEFYEVKLWIEADMPSLTLESLSILRDVDS